MSNVPKSRRKESRFEAEHQFYKLRAAVTELMINDFGFSPEKYEQQIERYRESHENAANVDEVVTRWEKKREGFDKWFIDKECDAVLKLLQQISADFFFGNSIFPSDTPAKIEEYNERRKHFDAAIANCFVLKQEIQYIIETLPVDLNKFGRFADMIDAQIGLFKGVRQADNRFLREDKKDKEKK